MMYSTLGVRERGCITGSVMLHITANEAGDIQTLYICKLKRQLSLPAALTGLGGIFMFQVLAPSAHFQGGVQLQQLQPGALTSRIH